MIDSGVRRFLERMPKVELHVHLEGSIPPATLLELAARHDVALPAQDVAGLAEWFRFGDFAEFVDIYLTCCRCLQEPGDFHDLVVAFAAEQARQNVVYTEAHFTVGAHLAHGVDGAELADAMADGLVAAEREHGVVVRLIPDIVRDVGPERADRTLEWALSMSERGVVALGLSGFEHQPNEPYREHFRQARRAGLGAVAHAGEHEGPQTIRSAIETCGAMRIGHGIRAVEDSELLEHLVEHAIPLEVCPTSNVALGAVPNLADHPLPTLERCGVEVTINADDPTFFSTTLIDELAHVHEVFGYDLPQIGRFVLTALDHTFLPEEERARLTVEFRDRFAALGEETVGVSVVPRPNPMTSQQH